MNVRLVDYRKNRLLKKVVNNPKNMEEKKNQNQKEVNL